MSALFIRAFGSIFLYVYFSNMALGFVEFDNPDDIGYIHYKNEPADVVLAKLLKQMGYEMKITPHDLMMLKKTNMSGLVLGDNPPEILRNLLKLIGAYVPVDGRWICVLVDKPTKICKIKFIRKSAQEKQ